MKLRFFPLTSKRIVLHPSERLKTNLSVSFKVLRFVLLASFVFLCSFLSQAQTVEADFSASPSVSCAVPATVFFTDQSTFPDTWLWQFGDGGSSTAQNPIHTYTSTGTFVVSLTISDTNFGTVSQHFDTIYVSVPTANFSGSPVFGCGPLTTTFSDLSSSNGSSVEAWSWNFGDGSTSNLQNPVHVYDHSGSFTVSLTITDANGCVKVHSIPNYINAIGPTANFGPASVPAGCPPLTVNFTDSSSFTAPIVFRSWDFGDGNSSNLQNPSHTYATSGLFDVSLTISDLDGCSRTYQRNGLVDTRDSIPPVIAGCVSNTSVANDAGQCGASVSWILPTATDNCTLIALTGSHNPGDFFPVGVTTVQYVATDDQSNADTCAFTITVTDGEPPVISCPSDVSVSNNPGTCGAVATYIVSATDNCTGTSVAQIAGLASGSLFPIGTTLNTFVAVDSAGNTDTCSFSISVTDAEPPSVTCPADIVAGNDVNTCGAVVNYSVSSSDNCTGDTLFQIAGLPSGSLFPIGTTLNTFVAVDSSGNTDSCSFHVTVNDTAAPEILCPANIATSNDANQCGAIVNFTITTSDNCPGEFTTQLEGLPSGSVFPLGVSTNVFMVSDSAGNTDTCSFTVTVLDTTAPVITCPAPMFANSDAGSCGAIVSYAFTTTDNCSLADTVLLNGLPSGSLFPVGVTTNTMAVTDSSGNADTCSFDITVADNEAPVFTTCPVDTVLSCDPGSCAAVLSYSLSATDNCGIDTIQQLSGLLSGSAFPKGSTQNVFVAFDSAGNSDTCTFTVTVEDLELPIIICAADTVLPADSDECSAIVTFVISSTDNCPGDTLFQTSGLASGSAFPNGTTVNTFVAIDSAGNSDTCRFEITVLDTQAPVIICPADTTLDTEPGRCAALLSYTTPVGFDECPGFTTVQMAGSASGSEFESGSTLNTFTVTDASGNNATCSFTVTVLDLERPVITCPVNVATCESLIEFDEPEVADNCAIAQVERTDALPYASGDEFPVGVFTFGYTVTDVNGNDSSCTFQITRHPEAVVTAGPDLVTTDILPVTLSAVTVNAVSVEWSPPEALDDPASLSPTAAPTATTTYVVMATSEDGCSAVDSMVVKVNLENELVAATLFTPNGDGRNDRWMLNKPELVAGCELVIFNRWGNEVFRSDNYDNSWDGTMNGSPLPEATYYYVIQCGNIQYSGPITLIRLQP